MSAVAARELPEDAVVDGVVLESQLVAAVIEDACRELGVKRADCVLSVPASSAALRAIRFPQMRPWERRQAARFEAERFASWDCKDVATIVRTHWINRRDGTMSVGVAREAAVQSRIKSVRRAGVRVRGVDYDACAMRRAFPFADAVLDVGHKESALHAFSAPVPISLAMRCGGADVTRGIARDLGIDEAAAERRKRILGIAGAGESAREAFVTQACAAIDALRETVAVRRLALVGNAARLPGLAEALEALSGALVEVAVSDLLRGGAYTDDVARAAAPDWTLAASLAAWAVS